MSIVKKSFMVATLMFSFLFLATVVLAGVAGSAGPTYPTTIGVGDTNVPVSLQIVNNSTSPQNAENILVTNIFHTPSCGSDASSLCQLADADPGVFQITGALTGLAGTACAGTTFTAGAPDALTGEVQLTPNTPVILGPSNVGGDAAICVVNFHVNVLKAPTKDSNSSLGIQTAQLARARFTAQTSGVEGGASGSSQVTVNKASPAISTIPSAGGPIGTVLNDTATLTGGLNPTGAVTFKLFPPTDLTCTGTASYTNADPSAPYATSPGFTSNAAGVWHWTADYAGDANNNATSSPCVAEPVTVVARGHIIVNKITVPAADPQSFAFTTTGTGYTGFSLTDLAAPNDQTLDAGPYSVAETAVSGWTPTSATCVSSNQDVETPAAISLQAGETVTCTFTNTKASHLIVQKTTLPAGDSTVFTVNASGNGTITGGGAGTITDALDKNYEVTPGTYSVAETLPLGWTQTSNTCNGVVVGPGETKTCVITNTKVVQYCSPGYWKQDQHFDSYVTYHPTDLFSFVFGESVTILWSEKGKPMPLANPTLLQALEANGGGLNSLVRATVNALLNSSALTTGYTPAQVISMFSAAYPGSDSDYEALKAQFTAPENCPLN